MADPKVGRRAFLAMTGAAGLAGGLQTARAAAQAAPRSPIKLPPPIGSEERLQRLAKARALMGRHGIGAIVIEPGASLDYFTGVQWWRSERLTAAIIPAQGEPIIVTPFFEKPSVEESLKVPAEVRTWDEHEEPLKLVADFLKQSGVAGSPIGFEETNRFFILDRLQQQLPGLRVVSANPVVRALRMIKSPTEIALMKAAADVTVAAFRAIHPKIQEGMTAGRVKEMFAEAVASLGGANGWGLVLLRRPSRTFSRPQLILPSESTLCVSSTRVASM